MQTQPYFVNSFGDRYLYEVNRNSFNQIGAASLYKQRYGEALLAKDSLTIVVGTDSGLLIDYIQERGVAEGSRFLFIEHPTLLPAIRSVIETDALDENIMLTDQQDLNELLKDISFSDYANIHAVRLIESLGATDDFYGEYRALFINIKQQLDSILWLHNVQLSNPSFVRRQLENLIEQHVPARLLSKLFEGRTAALLGGGPSLDELLPWIREHQNDLVIIAVSRICRRLREADVVPHLVVSIDPTELSFDISKEFLDLNPQAVLAHANHVTFPLLAQWRGRSIFLDRRYPWVARGETDNLAAAGPTVTNTGFALALEMGFASIVFAGIDLCHSSEGYTHARGSNEFDAGPRLGAAGIRVTTNHGRRAETSPDFFNAIKAFNAQALEAGKRGIRVINPAGGAAVMQGVEHVPVDQIELEVRGENPFDTLHACIDGDAPEQRRDNLATMQRELARAHGQLRNIMKLADEALACNDGLFGRAGKQADFRHKKRMDKIERELDNKFGDISEIVRMFSAQAFLHMPPSDREWTDEEIEQAGKTYYTAYRNNAGQILKLIEDAQHRIGTALEEESDTPDYERMLDQWESDGIPGRAQAWCHRHPALAADLPADVRNRFDELDAQFRTLMQVRDTGHARKMRDEAALGPVRGKMQGLLKERNTEELSNIVQQLEKLDSAEARQLRSLGLGYLSEIEGDKETAFGHYADLIDLARDQIDISSTEAGNPRLEDGLRRMVVIAMAEQWHDHALMILETLAGLSPAYEPQFAELLRLSGNTEAAVNVYTDYLSKVPGDHVSMLRLGRLYRSIGALDAAKTAFTYILAQDPDNQAARSLLNEIETAA